MNRQKSLSRETFRVKTAPFSYRDFHKEEHTADYHSDCNCVLFQDMDRKWFAANGVCQQFTQGEVSTLHLHQGHIEHQNNCLHFIFPPKLLSRDQQVSSILKFHKQAFIKHQKGRDSLSGWVITKLQTSLANSKPIIAVKLLSIG